MTKKGAFALLCTLLFLGASALAGPAEDPFFPARQGGQWGYIDRAGQWRIPPVWDTASAFMEGGIALVKVAQGGTGYRLIDKTGEALLELPDWERGRAAGFVVDGAVVIRLVEISPHDQEALYFRETRLLLPIEGESLELPGEITGRITVDKWDDRLAVGFRLKEPIVPEYGDRSFVLLDCKGRRATEKIYHGSYFSGNQYALVHGMDETIGTPGNVYSGMLMDSRGNVVMKNLPYGWVEGDLFLPRDEAIAWTVDGRQLTGKEKAGHFAKKNPWGLYPYTEDGITIYVDASGQTATELGEWEDLTPDDDMGGAAWPFDDALGVAWVEKKDVNATKGRSFALINTKGQVLSEGWRGGQAGGVPPVFKDGLCVVEGSNYLRPDGTTLFPGRPFAFAEHFNQGLGQVTLTYGPSMLMAYVDEGGRLVWAENGETEALQARLDALEKIKKLTPQEAARLLEGRWDLSAGGTIIGNPNTFYPDGTCDAGFNQPVRWEVRDYDEALGLFWNKPRFMLVFLDEAGEEVSSYGLTFSNPDEYSLTTDEGGGGYYRLKNESK